MGHPSMHNPGAYYDAKFGTAATATAAGTGDATEVNGEGVDRTNYLAMTVVLAASATLAATETAVYKMTIQDSADNSTFTDVAAALQPGGAANSTVLTQTGEGGGSTETDIYELDVDLHSLRQYVRIQTHIDLSAGGTDVAKYTGVMIMAGKKNLPS